MSDSLWPHGLYCPWNSPGQNTGVGSYSIFQGNFSTQGLNPGLLHCRQILYQLSHQGSPRILEWVSLSLLKRIFLTQESNKGLLHCRQILHQLGYKGNGKPLQYSCLENPMGRGAWWATVHGIARAGHNLPTKPPPHCFLLIISTLQMRKLRLRLNNFPKSHQVTEWLSIVFDFQRRNSVHYSILIGRWREK